MHKSWCLCKKRDKNTTLFKKVYTFVAKFINYVIKRKS